MILVSSTELLRQILKPVYCRPTAVHDHHGDESMTKYTTNFLFYYRFDVIKIVHIDYYHVVNLFI